MFLQTSTASSVAHPSSLLLLIQVTTDCCLFKVSTAEKEKQTWKRKKLTASYIKTQILQNIASGLENTENAVVTLMGSCAISGEHTLLPQLTGQGSDRSVLVRLR